MEQYPFPPHQDNPPPYFPLPTKAFYPAGRRELGFAAAMLLSNLFLWNSILYGGFHLGFALGCVAVTLCSLWYLLASGHTVTPYSAVLLVFSAVIAAGFARSNDGFVKFVLLHFLIFAVNLSLCLISGQNLRGSGTLGSVLDAPRAFFRMGLGGMGCAMRGLSEARKRAGSAGRKGGAVLLGLLIALPVAGILVVLLMQADAAFEGMMDLLPESDWREPVWTAVFGLLAAWILYARGAALHHTPKSAPQYKTRRGVSAITVNVVLLAVCLVYGVYLLSQLAYFSGGLSGILPEDYTLAQYARRGFFEMAWLSAINLTVMCCAMGFVEKTAQRPRFTRLLCLLIGLVTLFLIITASAKMLLYIGNFGLTRKRVLTEVIMIFLGITTVLVSVWLFRPKFPYMKGVVIAALLLGSITLWADVDCVVAAYNVRAYQSGQLETVDMRHLGQLGSGAMPYIAQLTADPDPMVAEMAEDILLRRQYTIEDFRSWNWSAAEAEEIQTAYAEDSAP